MKRVFIGFSNVAGYATRLLKGFDEIGISADAYVEGKHVFDYSTEHLKSYNLPKSRWMQRIYTRWFFLKCLFKYDAFLFISTQTFIKGYKDLKILRFFKKRTAMIFTGCDVQQPEMTYEDHIPYSSCHNCTVDYKKFVGCYPETKILRTRKIEGLIDKIVNDRALRNVLQRDSVHINQPIDIKDFPKIIVHPNNPIPVILHAPSNYGYKGTKFLIEAIKKLKKEFDFEFRLVNNVKLKDLYIEINKADLVVDQLIQGWFGMLPLEAMMYEKPVICYMREDVAKAQPADNPMINANPATIFEVLKDQLRNPLLWRETGIAGRKYVIKYHNASLIAGQYSDLLLK
ncbi:MAG: glycosyltransferase [Ignavibacteria bacterium]|nr:glycosyltransferase [Ignavibacteria bacterium]MCC7159430.1 glycosyltransferase [Ignavibacteria bacterium]